MSTPLESLAARCRARERRRHVRPLLATVASLALAPIAPTSAVPAAASLLDLSSFAGCWRTGGGASYTEEIWSAPTANLMLGLTLFVRDGKAVQHELTRVEQLGDRIVMMPYPNGTRSEHDFVLTALRDHEAIFEAPEHDFPKRILYRTNPDGSRTARIDGGADDAGGREWRFERVPCPGEP